MSTYKRLGSINTCIRIVETGETFKTSTECAERLGVCRSAISQCITGRSSTCMGYHLETVERDYHEDIPYEMFDGNTTEIPYAPGYFVSDLGIIYGPGSMGRRDYHVLDSYPNDKAGHQVVDIYIDGKRRHKYVAVLVAEAFIPNPYGYPIVRHWDGNPYNNHVSNLRWGTHADNMHDAMRHGTFHHFTPEEDKMALRVLRTPVKAIDIKTGEEFEFESQAEAARVLGVHQANIRHVLSGFYKKTGGYKFEYLDKESFDAKYYQ